MADAMPLMQMAQNILSNYNLQNGEGLALLSSNALTMSELCFTMAKLQKLLHMTEMATALAIIAENGNNSILQNPGFYASQHWIEKQNVILKLQNLLKDYLDQQTTQEYSAVLDNRDNMVDTGLPRNSQPSKFAIRNSQFSQFI